jgi:hypothetical protein
MTRRRLNYCSSMSVDFRHSLCYSTLPSYKVSTGCGFAIPTGNLETITTTVLPDGMTLARHIVTITGTSLFTSTITTVFDPSETSRYIGFSVLPVVALVHQPSDAQSGARGLTSSGGAGIARLGTASWVDLSLLLGICAVTIFAGIAPILLWQSLFYNRLLAISTISFCYDCKCRWQFGNCVLAVHLNEG